MHIKKINYRFNVVLLSLFIFVTNVFMTFAEDVDKVVDKQQKLLKLHPDDMSLGSKDAKVTFIEYSSLSCPACAIFHKEVFEQLKKEYIDHNLVLYIYRDYPINAPGLQGALLAHCIPGKFFIMQKILFDAQNKWAFRGDYDHILKGIARLSGIDNAQFDKCINDKNQTDKIIEKAFVATKILNIDATPTFFINGKKINGIKDFSQLKKIIDNFLNSH